VQRLEQVRLADAVRSNDKNKAQLQIEVEPLVRRKPRKLDPVDDQPGRRIGYDRGT